MLSRKGTGDTLQLQISQRFSIGDQVCFSRLPCTADSTDTRPEPQTRRRAGFNLHSESAI